MLCCGNWLIAMITNSKQFTVGTIYSSLSPSQSNVNLIRDFKIQRINRIERSRLAFVSRLCVRRRGREEERGRGLDPFSNRWDRESKLASFVVVNFSVFPRPSCRDQSVSVPALRVPIDAVVGSRVASPSPRPSHGSLERQRHFSHDKVVVVVVAKKSKIRNRVVDAAVSTQNSFVR